MYNLLVTAAAGAWDHSFYEYDRSRFLEYTNDNVASAFKGLTEERICMLKSFPCVFAYEGTESNVRVGYLKTIKERGRSILIEYEFDLEIPQIPFSSIEPIATLLDIRDWEMNRTHWAVKDENLLERLQAAKLLKVDLKKKVKKQEDIANLPELETHSSKVTSVQGFITAVLSKRGKGDFEFFYRGHSNKKKYKLEPSLFRKDDEGNYLYLDNEHILYRELIVSNSSDFVSDEYTLDRLVRMQHYSLPTRLLDITSNPLIALYFACKSKFENTQEGKYVEAVEGEVITFSLRREQVKYFDSDTASCIANLARLPKSDKDQISFDLVDIEAFNEQVPLKRLAHFIKEEKSFFEPKIVPEHLRTIVCVKGKKSNDRISSQSGAFLLFGLDAVLDEKGTPDIQVIRISVANKASILKELDLLNINESTVFPYIENSARYVAQKYAFKKSIQPDS
jgi:FRG domain